MDNTPNITALLRQYISGTMDTHEQEAFLEMLQNNGQEDAVQAAIQQLLAEKESRTSTTSFDGWESRAKAVLDIDKNSSKPQVHFFKTAWLRYAAAVIILLVIGSYMWFIRENHPSEIAGNGKTPVSTEILPGGNRAILTLSDGSTILLDSVANGSLAQQGKTRILKLNDGQLSYNPSQNAEGSPEIDLNNPDTRSGGPSALIAETYNTLTTPKGGQYQITLPDGTKVWLNAVSSIRFPTAFTGSERKVMITGEVYFEIMPDSRLPFRVTTRSQAEIEVLGTSFNVNAYSNETNINTTLIEGSVRVIHHSENKQAIVLRPGQQAIIKKDIKVEQADISQVMAWKNGLFNFEDASLKDVMRQLERWYNIEVVYEKGVPDIVFGGKMGRNLSLASVLKVLKKSEVQFRIEEGRRLIVYP